MFGMDPIQLLKKAADWVRSRISGWSFLPAGWAGGIKSFISEALDFFGFASEEAVDHTSDFEKKTVDFLEDFQKQFKDSADLSDIHKKISEFTTEIEEQFKTDANINLNNSFKNAVAEKIQSIVLPSAEKADVANGLNQIFNTQSDAVDKLAAIMALNQKLAELEKTAQTPAP